MTGPKAFRDGRQYVDHGGLAADPAYKSTSSAYHGLARKLELLWQPALDIQTFVDLTRSRDVPDFGDLTQTFCTTTRFAPIRSQHAWTLEAGTRGRADRLSWDLTAYRSLPVVTEAKAAACSQGCAMPFERKTSGAAPSCAPRLSAGAPLHARIA